MYVGRRHGLTATLFRAWDKEEAKLPLATAYLFTGNSQFAIQIQQTGAGGKATRIHYKLNKIQYYLVYSDLSALAGQISVPTYEFFTV